MKFYDTNAILKNYKNISEPFLISSTTLMELENIKSSFKKDEQTKYSARKAIRFLKSHRDLYSAIIVNNNIIDSVRSVGLPDTPDNEICASAAWAMKNGYNDITFVSEDLVCETIAHDVFKLPIETPSDMEYLYKGYKELKGDTATINSYLYNIPEKFVENEYLLIYNTDTDEESEMRYAHGRFVPLRLPDSKIIKAKNALQRCALDILNNDSITIAAILGYYGSGKTFVSMRMAVDAVTKGKYSKILGIREVIGEGKDIGDKTDKFFKPLIQQLELEDLEYDKMKDEGQIETEIPCFIKGTTYNCTIMLVDEAEDLTEKQIKLIGTRLGHDSKIILAGDYKQSVINNSTDNPLVRSCNELKGNPEFACIYLGEDVRSSASKLFAGLFDRD